MLIWTIAWIGGAAVWAFGVQYLLYLKRAQYDHVERMAEIAINRARAQHERDLDRADRASRLLPDLNRHAVAEVLTSVDEPTEVFTSPPDAPDRGPWTTPPDPWPSDQDIADQDETSGLHRLPTPH